MAATASFIARTTAPESSTFLSTTLANVLVLLVLPPVGILGLWHAVLALAARRRGDRTTATRRLESASTIAAVSLYGALAVYAFGAAMLLFLV